MTKYLLYLVIPIAILLVCFAFTHIFHLITSRKIGTRTIIITSSLLLLIITILSFGINFIFFHKETEVKGINTPCYINGNKKIYHSADCDYLDNIPIETTLYLALSGKGIECPFCTVDTNIHKTCYITEQGKHFHAENCHYLNKSSIKTTLYEALREDYDVCSYCEDEFNDILHKKCTKLFWGEHFHTKACKYLYLVEPYETKETTVYFAEIDGYIPCILCDFDAIDISTVTENNYRDSITIAVFSVLSIFSLTYLIYNRKSIKW